MLEPFGKDLARGEGVDPRCGPVLGTALPVPAELGAVQGWAQGQGCSLFMTQPWERALKVGLSKRKGNWAQPPESH